MGFCFKVINKLPKRIIFLNVLFYYCRNLTTFQQERMENLNELIQNLIVHKKVSDSNTLLKLYINNTLPCSVSSLQILELYFQHFEIPSEVNSEHNVCSSSSIKHQLLRWVLAIVKKKLANFFTYLGQKKPILS